MDSINTEQVYKVRMAVAERLRMAREDSGLQGKDFAAKLGLKKNRWYNYEQGVSSPSVGLLAFIAKSCGKPVSWFYGESSPAPEGRVRFEMDADFAPVVKQVAEATGFNDGLTPCAHVDLPPKKPPLVSQLRKELESNISS